MKLFTISEYDLEGDIDDVALAIRNAKKNARKLLKDQGKVLKEWRIEIERHIEYGYYDEVDIVYEVNAYRIKK